MTSAVGNLPASVAFLRDLYGGDFDSPDATVNVGVASTQLVQNDSERVAVTFINLGTDFVLLRPKAAPDAGTGIFLGALGGIASLNIRDDGMLTTFDWYALANSGNQNVYVLSVRRFNKVS